MTNTFDAQSTVMLGSSVENPRMNSCHVSQIRCLVGSKWMTVCIPDLIILTMEEHSPIMVGALLQGQQ